MKKLSIIIALIYGFTSVNAAKAQNCCIKQGIDMKELALNADFREAHLAPLPLNYSPAKGSMIQFNTEDAKKANAFFIPSDEPTNKVLIIFHEWWGLNDYIKREAENWQKLLGNVDVYAVDLYDGKVAADPETAGKLANALDPKRAEMIIKGVLSKIGPDRQVASLGWCMGGSWSFTAAELAGAEEVGCVMYYGFPDKEDKKIAMAKSDVLYIYGTQDKFIKQSFVEEFGDKIKANGHTFDLHTYDAVHAFANPSNPNYNSLAATQAQNLALKFLKDKLQLN